jgi:hypothetical protein
MKKCIDCGASITDKTAKKNIAKCNKCYKVDVQIGKELRSSYLVSK